MKNSGTYIHHSDNRRLIRLAVHSAMPATLSLFLASRPSPRPRPRPPLNSRGGRYSLGMSLSSSDLSDLPRPRPRPERPPGCPDGPLPETSSLRSLPSEYFEALILSPIWTTSLSGEHLARRSADGWGKRVRWTPRPRPNVALTKLEASSPLAEPLSPAPDGCLRLGAVAATVLSENID